ncbi:hypothetical protein E2C01_000201 [Portunus trituberculatus]|uniref:Uncharacterized protein n=1 Tax=Portunus trituberculatus TaxID=210409 RepID=A0A5B7CGN6_PORTR|nr:hypothetical protein [Portunus trituberculatus]
MACPHTAPPPCVSRAWALRSCGPVSISTLIQFFFKAMCGEGSDEADGGSGNEGRLSAQQVGSIVSSRAQEIAATSQHYSDLQQTIVLRALASLEQQRMALQGRLTEVEAEQAKARERVKEATGRLQDIKKERQKVEEEMRSLGVKDNASRR